MVTIRPAAVLLVVLVATVVPARAQATHEVRVEDNVFTPKTLQIEPGDTVEWITIRPEHSVTADDGRFDFHPDRWLNIGERVSWTFTGEEVVRYFCRNHGTKGGGGMAGVIRVGDPIAPVPPQPTVTVPDEVPTIADAAAGAEPGTEVLVRPGVYPEEVVVRVPDLTIRGIGEDPGEVILDGLLGAGSQRRVGITIPVPNVRVENLTVRNYFDAGIRVEGTIGAVVEDVVLDFNGGYGVDTRASSGAAMRRVTATRHAVAGIAVRGCERCGALIDDGILTGNRTGVAVAEAMGVLMRGMLISGNALGVALRDAAGVVISGSTLTGNTARRTWVPGSGSAEPPVGAGIWITGGRANRIIDNTIVGHTYNVAVTGPMPALDIRIERNTVDEARFADLGWDGVGASVCFSGNARPDDAEPSSEPPAAQTLYGCALPVTAGVPFPAVSANLLLHALGAG